MLILNDDTLLLLWKYYIKKNVICKKNVEMINNMFICKKMYDIYKKNKDKIVKFDCNLLYISKINYMVCDIHDNIGLEYANKIIGQVEKYMSLQDMPQNDEFGFNFHKFHVSNFIHSPNLKENESFLKKLLKKYNLKIVRYCCDGGGCELKQIKKK